MLGQMIKKPLLISGLIEHAVRFHGDTDVISVETTGGIERTHWEKIGINARRLASTLGKLGVEPGDRCGTIAWNNRRHLEIYFGVSGGGMVCHTLNPRLAPETLVYVINHAKDKILFVDRTFLPLVANLAPKLETVRRVVVLGPRDAEVGAMLEGLMFYDELLEAGDEAFKWPELDEMTASSLCYTSGTTGHPKGVVYSHRSTVLHSLVGCGPDAINIAARDTVMPVVPMFHVNAWGVPYIAAMQGARLVLPGPQLDGPSLAQLIDTEQVTLALGVPTIWMGLLAALRDGSATAASMKRTIVGGSALPPSMIAAFQDEFGIELIHAWGMTETSPLGTLNQLKSKHVGMDSAQLVELRKGQGRPPYGVELRIVGEDNMPLANDGLTQGRLQIRGHWIVDTYFGMDAPALTPDGWFDTGDIASLDAEGYLVIKDRAKDVIKSGGEWIASVELENIAIAHPGIANAAVIAAQHEKWDERPVVVAVKSPGSELDAAGLLAWFDGKVPAWQKPDAAFFVDALPVSGTGKVLKKELREIYGAVLTGNPASCEA
ncbi:3-methylmercaptopropionyl-CoA ligase [Pseudomonas extremaustralis]|uniref:3-methylmercaptopropionyl-CoA ligase n=1 Tax=Pseudomonas extremaustralis TaxID=359110 RepID=A0A5M9J2T4_9PSED|nr:long-chain fatty acid--CoA ligase [Pseudomonas extremaustralis]KAA8562810.1 3-methylmercaptopropionyl-CoA ligase [Pseudomonas extremaustralis]